MERNDPFKEGMRLNAMLNAAQVQEVKLHEGGVMAKLSTQTSLMGNTE